MSSIDDFRSAMEQQPDDVAGMQAQADLLQEQGDPRGLILAAACLNELHLANGAFSADQSALRLRYQRIMRGDVPLDSEHLEGTLQIQYAKQVELLASLKLLEEDDNGRFLIAIDGKRYPLPDFEEVLKQIQTPELQSKLRQGLDTLLLVPFGLPLPRFIDA